MCTDFNDFLLLQQEWRKLSQRFIDNRTNE